MSYNPKRNMVQEVTIQLECQKQMMIEKHFLIFQTPDTTSPGDSATMLGNFKIQYRAHFLAIRPTALTVTKWSMHELIGSRVVLEAPPAERPRRFVNLYDDTKKEVQYGTGGIEDRGQAAITAQLPLHEAIGMFREPVSHRRGYFEGSYIRMSPFGETYHHDTEPEQLTQECLDAYGAAGTNFIASPVLDVIGPATGWVQAIWSPSYWFDFIAASGAGSYGAALPVASFKPSKYIRTQVHRRYTPAGIISGK